MFYMLLLSYRNTDESLGELGNVVETAHVPTAFLVLPNFYHVLVDEDTKCQKAAIISLKCL